MALDKAISRILLAASAAWLGATPAWSLNLFQVGNSFTFDSLAITGAGFSTGPVSPVGTVEMLEGALGEPVDLGYHVRGSTTLSSMWSDPDSSGTFFTGHGRHPIALPNNHWDYLTLQTFPANSMPTLGDEVASMQNFIDSADLGSNGSTKVIVYGPWAGESESAWSEWDAPVADDPDTVVNHSSSYQNLLYDKVAELYPGRVRLASAGKVIREMRERILAGDAPVDSTDDLYRDPIHLSKLGRFAASTTIQTSILGRSTVGVPVPREVPNWSDAEVITDEQAGWVQLLAWEVLLADRRSGVTAPESGDFDGNGVIDTNDYEVWRDTEGSTERLLADADNNGLVDAADYTVWLEAYLAAQSPEPSTCTLLAIAFGFAVRRARI